MPPQPRSAPGRSATSRALSILDAFDDGHRALNLSQIAERSGLPLGTAHRLIRDLCDARLLSKHPQRGYEIGARTWRLGLLASPTTLRETALPHLQDAVMRTGRTVHLAVLDGHQALVVERLAGSRTQPTRHRPGGRLPLHCTAVGKVLLAHAPAAVRDAVLEAPARFTPWTITDRGRLQRQIEDVRERGVAYSAQEHRAGVSSLAVPVTAAQGHVAALGVLAPLTTPRLSSAAGPLLAAASAISAATTGADLDAFADGGDVAAPSV